MSVLNSIRKRGIFLIIVIAMALFAFILADLIGQGSFSRENQSKIGKINSKDISYFEFSNRLQSIQQNAFGNLTTIQAVNQLWDATVEQTLIEQEMDKLGIEVGSQQLVSALAMQFSQDPQFLTNGQFDINKFRGYIEQLKTISPEAYQQWIMNEQNIAEQAKAEVYFDLLGAGIGVTTQEAKDLYKLNNTSFDLQYVKIPFSSVSDDEVSVSDSEIKKYINEHKEEFTSDGLRNIRYTVFEEKATSEDEEDIKNELANLLEDHTTYNKAAGIDETVKGFKNVEDYEEYLSEFSDLSYEDTYLFKKDLPSAHADTLSNLEVGEVYGPYKENDYWKYSKIAEAKEMPDSVNVKHILISYSGIPNGLDIDRTRDEAEQIADSILAEVKADKDLFEELAEEYSEDPQTANNGGEIGWITYPKGEKNDLIDFIFGNEAGSAEVIETESGFHITYIDETRNEQKAVKIATLARKIEPSDKTVNDVFNKTTSFQMSAQEGDFSEEANKNGYDVRTVNNLEVLDENITGLGAHRDIVQWTFEDKVKVGDITRFDIDEGYVVVQLTSKTSKGLASVDEARDRVEPILLKKKKAEHIIAQISSNDDLSDIASSYGTQPKTKNDVDFENPDLEGKEPKVLAKAFSLDQNEVSKPIAGDNAVYVIKLLNKREAEDIGSYNGIVHRENEQALEEAFDKIFEALKNKAKIEDYRTKFY